MNLYPHWPALLPAVLLWSRKLFRLAVMVHVPFDKIENMSASVPEKIAPGQNLLIDADDTLWENNIYFERAITDFISFLNHHHYTPDEVRHVLYDVERENIRQHGYGMHSFANALVICFEKLSVEPVTPELHETIRGIAYQIAEHPMEFLPEVPETLADLSQRHRLFMVTKGNITEQLGKVERSGLKDYFTAIEVVAEKDAAGLSGSRREIRVGTGASRG